MTLTKLSKAQKEEMKIGFIFGVVFVVVLVATIGALNYKLAKKVLKDARGGYSTPITNTIIYYNDKELKHCPLTDEVPCADLKGNIILDRDWAK